MRPVLKINSALWYIALCFVVHCIVLCGSFHCALWSIALCFLCYGPLHCVCGPSIVFCDSVNCALWSIALCFVHYGPFIVLCDGYFTSCFVVHLIARCVGYLVFYFLVDLHCIVLYGAEVYTSLAEMCMGSTIIMDIPPCQVGA